MEAIFLEQEADQEFISRKIYRYEVYIIKYICDGSNIFGTRS